MNNVAELIDAISGYHQDFISSNYSTMGFQLLVLGWLITSDSAQKFLNRNKELAYFGIFFAVAGFSALVRMSFGVQSISKNISDRLASISSAKGLYEHYLLSKSTVGWFMFFQALPAILIITTLCFIVFRGSGTND